MPELPDVEGYRRFFSGHATGRTVRRVVVTDPAIVRNAAPEALDRALRGRTFAEPERHGKWLLAWTDGPALLFHFGMTGWFLWGESPEAPEPRHRHDRVIVELQGGGEVRYRNMRKLGGVWLAHDAQEARLLTGGLGPDALAVDRRAFREMLSRRRGGAKAVLMDQRFMAGVGNLLADEILWQARIHPKRRVEDLTADEREELFDAVRRVVRESVAVESERTAFRRTWLLSVRGDQGATCPRCGTPLARTAAAGRTTWFCPADQPEPSA